MGIYVNSKTAYTLYKSETAKPYFIDKILLKVRNIYDILKMVE